MKRNILIGILFLTILSSCSKWLDLQPETKPTDEQILATTDGYRVLLNGLYRTMGSEKLYGRDMTFGLVDCISQQYKLNLGAGVTNQNKYIAAGKFDYENTDVQPVLRDTWQEGFKVIANANRLLQQIENASPEDFAKGEMERNLIMGEALAVRALVHFDLLRLFAPAPINDDGKNYVPFVDVYPTIVPTPIAIQPFLQRVIDDLEEGKKLVAEYDTSKIGIGTLASGPSRFFNEFIFGTEIYSNSTGTEDFFKGRGYRLSYFAISAILARVYNYVGKHQEAFDNAKTVMDFQVKDYYGVMVPSFSTDNYQGIMSSSWDSRTDLKTVSNLVFGIHNGNAVNELALYLYFQRQFYGSGYTPTWLVINKDAQKLFYSSDGADEESFDIRAQYLIYYASASSGVYPISGKYYQSTIEVTRDKNSMIIPVIRSSELRYIMAEYYAKKNEFGMAKNMLQSVRVNRRLASDITVSNWTEFQRELIIEARREFVAEGQLLFLYKRLNAPVDFGNNVTRPLTRAEYLPPIPQI